MKYIRTKDGRIGIVMKALKRGKANNLVFFYYLLICYNYYKVGVSYQSPPVEVAFLLAN